MTAVAEVIELSAVERLVRELGAVGQVKIKAHAGGSEWWVQFEPLGCTPLWWYAHDKSLQRALEECHSKAVLMGFIKVEQAA